MIGRYEATLNGINLTSIDPAIVVTDISYDRPDYDTDFVSVAKRHGSRVHRRMKDRASCTVTFAIRAYNTADRNRICQQVIAWARDGGELQTSDRDGQKLVCICDALPTVSSALRWTDPVSVTFSAYALPWWQETAVQNLTLSGGSGNGNLYVPGTAPEAMVEVQITPTATLATIHLDARDKRMSLTGLNISGGTTINISYDANMIQSIKAGNVSLLPYRSGADDLIAVCGKLNYMGFIADANCVVLFKTRGLWD